MLPRPDSDVSPAGGWITLVALTLTGCLGVAELSPAGGLPSPLDEAASARVGQVELTAQAARWPDLPIEREVTPLRILLRNESERPIRLSYEDFELVRTDTGRRYAALPPLAIEGTIEKPLAHYDRPGFGHERFRVAPHHAWYYPGLQPWPETFAYDDLYYRSWYGRWAEIPLPTPEMVAAALPEGVVQPGGFVDGWLYFERLPAERGPVEFRFQLVDAESEDVVGVATIPFLVR